MLIGENRPFDQVFATYVPKSKDSVKNLLSEGIVKADGSPGSHFGKAAQFQAVALFRTEYFVSLKKNEKAPYQVLPQPSLNFASTSTIFPPGTPDAFLAMIEPPLDIANMHLLTTGAATGFPQTFIQPDPDKHIQNFDKLPERAVPAHGGATLAALDRGTKAADEGRLVPLQKVRQRMKSWQTKSSSPKTPSQI